MFDRGQQQCIKVILREISLWVYYIDTKIGTHKYQIKGFMIKVVLFSESLKTLSFQICDSEVFPVHRFMLAARSSVFKAMFKQENTVEANNRNAEIKDVDPKIYKLLSITSTLIRSAMMTSAQLCWQQLTSTTCVSSSTSVNRGKTIDPS